MDVNDDPESQDAAPLDGTTAPSGDAFDLTPRTSAQSPARKPTNRRWIAVSVLVVLVGALGYVLFQGLNDAATFFYNVDEAVEQRDDLADGRFRMQGNVVEGTVAETADGVEFVVTYAGAEVPVLHSGTPPELFGPDIPVVIEGSFEGDTFHSDEILIRHDNTYDEENPDRIDEAERDAQATSEPPVGGTDGDGQR